MPRRTIVIATVDVGSRAKLGWCRIIRSGDRTSEDAGSW